MRFLTSIAISLLFSHFLRAQQLVLPGDHPDPSVVRIGNTYWASATTSNWFPAYPLLRSEDLVHWRQQGYVFETMPAWADYYFWAPEISYDKGRIYIYYAAHKKNGNLCVGVASADRPEGPYKDHGPLICQEVGSIDAFPMRDEQGRLYLVWKEDANSVGKPTSIWAQEMNEERTALAGPRKELLRNDTPWEGNLVEGVSMVRQGEYFYAFYAGAGCCGTRCSYGVGIARSKSLLGPWEKYPGNPVLKDSERWTCPGHGTPVEKDGRHYFLFHAYDRQTNVFTGRQGLLIEYRFTSNNWIEFVKQDDPSRDVQPQPVADEFRGHTLANPWQWSVFQTPQVKIRKGRLELTGVSNPSGAFIGQKIENGNYTASATLCSKKAGAPSGLAAIGDENNLVAILLKRGRISLVQVREGKEFILLEKEIARAKRSHLRMQVKNGKDIYFLYSNNGRNFALLNEKAVDGSFLPPWDRAVRAGLVAKGRPGEKGKFLRFELSYQ